MTKTLLKSQKKNVAIVVNQPPDVAQRTFVVLGVQRGGTSMVAGVLRALGVDLGHAGLNHEDNRFLGDDPDKLRRAIGERDSELDVWGFKAPEATMQLDVLEESLRNPFYIAVMRNIAAVIDSWMERGAKDPAAVMHRTLRYYNRIGRLARETDAPLLIVNYERAAINPAEFVDSVIAFSRISVSDEMREKAIGMITGDGGGYLNVPEEYFHVELLDNGSLSLSERDDILVEKTRNGTVDVTSPDGTLPRTLRLRINWTPRPSGAETVTFTFRFESGYSSLHNQSFHLHQASGTFEISTGGHARGCRIATASEWDGELDVVPLQDEQPQAN